jgi:hypothetical protein
MQLQAQESKFKALNPKLGGLSLIRILNLFRISGFEFRVLAVILREDGLSSPLQFDLFPMVFMAPIHTAQFQSHLFIFDDCVDPS